MSAATAAPAALVRRLNQETAAVLERADIKSRFWDAGLETSGGTPEHFGRIVRSEMARLGKVIKDAGIQNE